MSSKYSLCHKLNHQANPKRQAPSPVSTDPLQDTSKYLEAYRTEADDGWNDGKNGGEIHHGNFPATRRFSGELPSGNS